MHLLQQSMKHLQQYLRTSIQLVIFTIFSILVRGYEYGGGNQVHYFNFAFHKFYPELYSQDYLFKIHDLPYTIFVDLLVGVLKIFGENAFIFFSIYFIFLLLFYTAIYAITQHFFKNKTLSLVMLVFFIFPIPIGGSTIYTVEMSLMPRFVAEIFLLFSIYFLLIKKHIASPITAGIGFLIHPLTMIPYIPIVILSEIIEHKNILSLRNILPIIKNIWRPIVTTICIFLLVASPILIKFFHGQSGSIFIDKEWLSVVYERLPYLFIWHWSIINFLVLFIICIYFTMYRYIFKKKLDSIVIAIVVTSLTFFGVAFLSSVYNFRLGLQLQIARTLYLLVVFAIIYGLGSFLNTLSLARLKMIAVIASVISIMLCFPVRRDYGILWVNPLEDYQKAAVWAKNNTPRDSVFLVPLDEFGFRFWSKRAVFLEVKEGGDSLYERSFAMEWNKREELIKANTDFKTNYINKLKDEYQVNYIVTRKNIPGLLIVYKKNNFTIYRY